MAGLNVVLDPKKSRRENRRELADFSFVESPRMEALLKAVTANPEMELSSNTRMAVYLYRDQKARAARVRQFEIASIQAQIIQLEKVQGRVSDRGATATTLGELRERLAELTAKEGGE